MSVIIDSPSQPVKQLLARTLNRLDVYHIFSLTLGHRSQLPVSGFGQLGYPKLIEVNLKVGYLRHERPRVVRGNPSHILLGFQGSIPMGSSITCSRCIMLSSHALKPLRHLGIHLLALLHHKLHHIRCPLRINRTTCIRVYISLGNC